MLLGLQTSSLINWLTYSCECVCPWRKSLYFCSSITSSYSLSEFLQPLFAKYLHWSPHFEICSSHSYRFVCGKQENLSICLRSEKKVYNFFMKSILNLRAIPKVEFNSQQCWTASSINLLISCMYENHLIHLMAKHSITVL